MAYTGLMGKMRKAVGLATIGLAALVPTKDAEAQSANLSVSVEDSNHNQVSNAQPFISGQDYYVTLMFNPALEGLDVSSFKSSLKLTFSGLNSGDVSFDYVGSPNGQYPNGNGTPLSNDLFAGATIDAPNTYFNAYAPIDASNGTFGFQRAATGDGSLSLSTNPYAVATFKVNASQLVTGGSLILSLDDADTIVAGGANTGFGTFQNGVDLYAFGQASFGNGNYQLNFTAVPEPSTYALMAGGLALAGAVAMRKRRQQDKGSGGSSKSTPASETREI